MENNEILLKELGSRLSYNVKLSHKYKNNIHILSGMTKAGIIVMNDSVTNEITTTDIENVKPYLFPISSMTEEIMDEIYNTTGLYDIYIDSSVHIEVGTTFEDLTKVSDILHKYHIDYRGLIEKGLAIDATGKNIY